MQSGSSAVTSNRQCCTCKHVLSTIAQCCVRLFCMNCLRSMARATSRGRRCGAVCFGHAHLPQSERTSAALAVSHVGVWAARRVAGAEDTPLESSTALLARIDRWTEEHINTRALCTCVGGNGTVNLKDGSVDDIRTCLTLRPNRVLELSWLGQTACCLPLSDGGSVSNTRCTSGLQLAPGVKKKRRIAPIKNVIPRNSFPVSTYTVP
jgi:hypothetical protein